MKELDSSHAHDMKIRSLAFDGICSFGFVSMCVLLLFLLLLAHFLFGEGAGLFFKSSHIKRRAWCKNIDMI